MIITRESLSSVIIRIWRCLTELPFLVTYNRKHVHNRSIVRAIGTILPLPPAPRVYFNLATWNPEMERFTSESGCEIVSPKPLHKEKESGYQQQIDHLQEELQAIKNKLAVILERETRQSTLEHPITSNKNDKNGDLTPIPIVVHPPTPPPPPPMPELNLTSKPPPLVKSKKKSQRSPGGRPIKPKREPEFDPSNILAQVLKKRYSVIQESSDAESFNASFTDLPSPIKSAVG